MDLLDELIYIYNNSPDILIAALLMGCGLTYFALWCILPLHTYQHYPRLSFYVPIVCFVDVAFCACWIADPTMQCWLPRYIYRKLTGDEAENSLSFSPRRWWQWRKKALLPTNT